MDNLKSCSTERSLYELLSSSWYTKGCVICVNFLEFLLHINFGLTDQFDLGCQRSWNKNNSKLTSKFSSSKTQRFNSYIFKVIEIKSLFVQVLCIDQVCGDRINWGLETNCQRNQFSHQNFWSKPRFTLFYCIKCFTNIKQNKLNKVLLH